MNCNPISVTLPNGLSVECECASEVAQQVQQLQDANPGALIRVSCEGDVLTFSQDVDPEGTTDIPANV